MKTIIVSIFIILSNISFFFDSSNSTSFKEGTYNANNKYFTIHKLNDSMAIFRFDTELTIKSDKKFISLNSISGLAYKGKEKWIGYVDDTELNEKNALIKSFVEFSFFVTRDFLFIKIENNGGGMRFPFEGKYKYKNKASISLNFNDELLDIKNTIVSTKIKQDFYFLPDKTSETKGFLNSNTKIEIIRRYKNFYYFFKDVDGSRKDGWIPISSIRQ